MQPKGRSSSHDPDGERGEQRPPPCPPPQPHGIESDAPGEALPHGERGWAHPLSESGVLRRKCPSKSHNLRCAGGDFGAAPGQSWYNRLRTLRCPLDTEPSQTKRMPHPLPQNSRSDSANVTSRKATSWGWCSQRRACQPGLRQRGPTWAQDRLRLTTLHRRRRMRRRSQRGPNHLPRAPAAVHVAQPPQAHHEQSQEKEPYLPCHLWLRPAGQQYRQSAGRRERKRWPNQPATAPVLHPQTQKSTQGLHTEGSVWVWRGPKSTGTGEESAKEGLVLAEYPD